MTGRPRNWTTNHTTALPLGQSCPLLVRWVSMFTVHTLTSRRSVGRESIGLHQGWVRVSLFFLLIVVMLLLNNTNKSDYSSSWHNVLLTQIIGHQYMILNILCPDEARFLSFSSLSVIRSYLCSLSNLDSWKIWNTSLDSVCLSLWGVHWCKGFTQLIIK